MILGRLVLILFFSLQLISWPIRAEDRAEDLDQNFNLTVFPAARMESKYSYPTPSQTQTLDQIRARFVDQIKLAQASWYPSLLDSQIPSEFERQVVETSMKRTPIWLCKGRQCEGCPNDHSYSCVLGRKILNSVGAAILLHPCHLSNSGCGLTSMSLEQVIEKELSVLAFYKLKKVPKYVTAVAGYRSATSTLQHASAVFQDLLRACPGSLPLTGFNYLLNFRHLVEITSLGCIERILTPLRNLPHSCRSLESSEGFRKRFKNGLFRAERKGYRCDSLCQVMTCGKGKSHLPRIIQFGEREMIAFPPEGCNETQSKASEEFYLREIAQFLHPKVRAQCLNELITRSASERRTSPNDSLKGPEIELIEN